MNEDDVLKEELLKRLHKLRREIDWVGDKDLRQALDEHATHMYRLINKYDVREIER